MPDSCMFDPSGVEKRWINAFLLMFDLSEVFFAKIRDDSCLPEGLYIYDLQVNGRQVLERKMSVARK